MTIASRHTAPWTPAIFYLVVTLHVELMIASGQLAGIWHVLSHGLCLVAAVAATPSDLRPSISSDPRPPLSALALLVVLTAGRAAQFILGVLGAKLVLHPVFDLLDLPSWPGYFLLVAFLLCMTLGTAVAVMDTVGAWRGRHRVAHAHADGS